MAADPPEDLLARLSYSPLVETAEGVRWKVSDLPWGAFDASAASDGLKALVREMAFYEQTTFSATQRFMAAFSEDLDFTQWVSVWFYEETRHPLVLMRWLSLAGERVDSSFVTRGRVSAPLMRSRMGTLVTNVISEMTASAAYLALADVAPEPLLRAMTERISGDEARHGASFFRYAQQRLERAEDPARERLDAVKVLHFWLNETDSVTHPVNQTMQRLSGLQGVTGVRTDPAALRGRICGVVAALTGEAIRAPADVPALLAELTHRVHGSS